MGENGAERVAERGRLIRREWRLRGARGSKERKSTHLDLRAHCSVQICISSEKTPTMSARFLVGDEEGREAGRGPARGRRVRGEGEGAAGGPGAERREREREARGREGERERRRVRESEREEWGGE